MLLNIVLKSGHRLSVQTDEERVRSLDEGLAEMIRFGARGVMDLPTTPRISISIYEIACYWFSHNEDPEFPILQA